MDAEADERPNGPYRATKLWNEIIRVLRADLPLKRHRRHMRQHENCFSASDAADWLHAYLCRNPNFGSDVSRQQTIQLLSKLHKAGVFESTRGTAQNQTKELKDNQELYRFSHNSPLKPQAHQTPLRDVLNVRTSTLPRSSKLSAFGQKKRLFEKVENEPIQIPEFKEFQRQLTVSEIENTWKIATLERLQAIMGLPSLEDILDADAINSKYVIHNMNKVLSSGIVAALDKSSELPYWILNAMKCLTVWPTATGGGSCLPNYPGFEQDVFIVVRDYFQNLEEPLTTFKLYDMLISIIVRAEYLDLVCHSFPSAPTSFLEPEDDPSMTESVEDLMRRMASVFAGDAPRVGSSDQLLSTCPSFVSSCPDSLDNTSRLSRSTASLYPSWLGTGPPDGGRVSSMPLAAERNTSFGLSDPEPSVCCFETAFEAASPVTRVVPRSTWRETAVHSVHQSQSTTSFHPSNLNSFRQSQLNDGFYKSQFNNGFYQSQSSDVSNESLTNDAFNQPTAAIHQSLSTSSDSRGCRHYGSAFVLGARPDSRNVKVVQWRDAGGNGRSITPRDGNLEIKTPPPIYENMRHYDDVTVGQLRPISAIDCGSSIDRCDNGGVTCTCGGCSSVGGGEFVSLDAASMSSVGSYHTAQSHHSALLQERDHMSTAAAATGGALGRGGSRLRQRRASVASATLPSRGRFVASSPRSLDTDSGSWDCAQELRRYDSTPAVFTPKGKTMAVAALQVALLLLPPDSRRRLHQLLRFMSLVADNRQLVLQDSLANRDLILNAFSRCLVRAEREVDYDEVVSLRLITFLVNHHDAILTVPHTLYCEVQDRLLSISRTKVKYCGVNPITYCEQVTVEEYEHQKVGLAHQAIAQLLDNLINDTHLPDRVRKKKLKQFKKLYPQIYASRFPAVAKKSTPLFSNPLHKFRSLRM